MTGGTIRCSFGSVFAALPWCWFAPAVFALGGVATAGVGTAIAWATPLFLVLSLAFLGRALHLALVRRHGRFWARVAALAFAPLVAGLWIYRLDLWPG